MIRYFLVVFFLTIRTANKNKSFRRIGNLNNNFELCEGKQFFFIFKFLDFLYS
jgi:hypothetical protein